MRVEIEYWCPERALVARETTDKPVWNEADAAQKYREWLDDVLARARDLGALAYESRNPQWLENLHSVHSCREVGDDEIEFDSPIGKFRLAARRAQSGDLVDEVTTNPTGQGHLRTASKTQESPPVRLHGRLVWPQPRFGVGWQIQLSQIQYADGTFSGTISGYPRAVERIG